MKPLQLKQEMAEELDNILRFWLEHTVDRKHGGFVGLIRGDMTTVPEAPKGLVLNTRILWTFARAFRHEPKPEYLEMAERALQYLETYFRDPDYPGYFWMVDYKGQPLQTKKQIYGLAFYLYALSELILATGREDLLPLAEEVFEAVELGFDPVHSGYVEACARDWSEDEQEGESIHEQNEKKSMNAHLHVLEAYTNYYRVVQTPKLKERFERLLRDMLDRIVDEENGRFHLYFDGDWTLKSHVTSYGHDIEGSWLLLEAAELFGDPELLERTRNAALKMADAVLANGVDTDGAVMWEGDENGVFDTDKHWWVQAEAVVGFVNAWQMTGDERYWKAAADCWTFTRRHIVDPVHGEWFSRTDREGNPDSHAPKVNEWKCPYHNGRACFEIIERLNPGV